MNSQNLLIILFLIALAVTMIGWRTVLVMVVTTSVSLVVLGLVEIVSLVGSGA